MAAITDLTWQQLQTEIGTAGAIAISGTTVAIDVSLVTGDATDALTDAGVLKFVDKLLSYCLAAQTTANGGQVAGERLNSFSAPTYGSVLNGQVPVNRTVSLRYALESTAEIVGPNA